MGFFYLYILLSFNLDYILNYDFLVDQLSIFLLYLNFDKKFDIFLKE